MKILGVSNYMRGHITYHWLTGDPSKGASFTHISAMAAATVLGSIKAADPTATEGSL